MPNPSRPPDDGREPVVVIDRMAGGGDGIARYEGRAVFVSGSLPGDRVRVRLLPARGGRLEGRVVELLEPSPARVAPPCPYAGRCGGCAWLALDLAAQRRGRADVVRDALVRIGRLEAPAEIPVVAVDPSGVPPGLGYRARIEAALGPAGERGRRAVGFRAAASHEVVDVERCAVASPPVAAAFERLRAAAAAGRVPPPIVEVEIAVGDDPAHVVATARLGAAVASREAARLADRLVAAWPGLAGLRLEPPAGAAASAVERGRTALTVTVPGPGGRPLPLEVPAGVFMQANPAVNARLVEAVARAVAPREGVRLLDLYCGAGNFALPL
ncbi:MAG TPA: TRAM domain-containing protein, partial [Thermodesulfobacteriota bacterium]